MNWPGTLRTQFVVTAAAAVILASLIVIAILETARQSEIQRVRIAGLADRVAASFELIADLEPSQRDGAVRALNTVRFRYRIVDENPFGDHKMSAEETRMAEAVKMAQEETRLGPILVRLPPDTAIRERPSSEGGDAAVPTDAIAGTENLPPGFEDNADRAGERLRFRGNDDIEMAQGLDSGRWLFVNFDPPAAEPRTYEMLIAALLAAIFTSAAAAWLGGRVSRPLSALEAAAGEIARGNLTTRVEPRGPRDVRKAAEAFNTMSERVARTIQSHHQLLSAVGHDLRTPLAAMRITAEFVTDPESKMRLTRNIDELNSLTEAVLSAARAGPGEEMYRVELGALIESVCDDLIDLGQPMEVAIEGSFPCLCRSNEVRRAVRNLVENAVRYGGSAQVSLRAEPEFYAVVIDDKGPGIPEDKLESVFQPFMRLEASRSSDTGGFGLGLTIARTIARENGGDINLENRRQGGLRATLRLPREKRT